MDIKELQFRWVGRMLYGLCDGFFGQDSHKGDKRIVALGEDWIVVRNVDGVPEFAKFRDTRQMIDRLEEWASFPEDLQKSASFSTPKYLVNAGRTAINEITLNHLEVEISGEYAIGDLIPMVNKKTYRLSRYVSPDQIYLKPAEDLVKVRKDDKVELTRSQPYNPGDWAPGSYQNGN